MAGAFSFPRPAYNHPDWQARPKGKLYLLARIFPLARRLNPVSQLLRQLSAAQLRQFAQGKPFLHEHLSDVSYAGIFASVRELKGAA